MPSFNPLHVLLGGLAMLAILTLEGPRKLATLVVLIIVVIAAVQVFSPPEKPATARAVSVAQ